MARKKPIISPLGQWAYPGEVTIIPSSDITMKGVNYPVLGIDDLGNQQMMMPGQDYTFPGDYVTEIPQMGKGGLAQWFDEKWVDVKTGKTCGRSGKDKDGRPYPACRPSKRVNETTPKTTSEMSSSEKARFKREKTSGKRIDYNHKRREEGGEIGWLDEFQVGGVRPPIYTSDLSKVRSYNDSNTLYNSYLGNLERLKKIGQPIQTNDATIKSNYTVQKDNTIKKTDTKRMIRRWDESSEGKISPLEYPVVPKISSLEDLNYDPIQQKYQTKSFPGRSKNIPGKILEDNMYNQYVRQWYLTQGPDKISTMPVSPDTDEVIKRNLKEPQANLFAHMDATHKYIKPTGIDKVYLDPVMQENYKALIEYRKNGTTDSSGNIVSDSGWNRVNNNINFETKTLNNNPLFIRRYAKPFQPYIYTETPVAPAPIVEPPKPSLAVSNIDRDMYTPGGGMAREYNIGVTLQDGNRKSFRTEKEFQDWKAANNLDISKAKVTEGRGYSYDYYPENKKYGGWLNQYQDGGEWLDDEPEVNPKIGWNSGNRYSYDKKGNLIYTNPPFDLTYDAQNFINNALDTNTGWLGNPLNSYEIDFLKNAKNKINFNYWEPAPEFQFQTQVDKLNPSLDELINVTQNIYPDQYAIDNSFSKASKSRIDLPASAFENDIKERYVIPDILKNSINKRFGTLPTTRDDSYSPNRIWTTKVKNDERSTVGARFATDGDNSKYAYVLTPNSKKTSDLSKEKINTKKETVENSLSSIDNKFYENLYLKYPDYIQYPGNYNNPEISLFGNIKNRLPNQMWNRAEQMRVEMLNNPEIKDWADLHNVNLSRGNEDSKQNLVIDGFAPKVPESVYANRLVKAGLPVSTPDYDYDSDDTYIVQDPSKFNLAGYFPISKDYDEENAKQLIAKKLGIKPEQLNNKDYLIHYNKTPITEYKPGKKYGGWLNQYQTAGEVSPKSIGAYTNQFNEEISGLKDWYEANRKRIGEVVPEAYLTYDQKSYPKPYGPESDPMNYNFSANKDSYNNKLIPGVKSLYDPITDTQTERYFPPVFPFNFPKLDFRFNGNESLSTLEQGIANYFNYEVPPDYDRFAVTKFYDANPPYVANWKGKQNINISNEPINVDRFTAKNDPSTILSHETSHYLNKNNPEVFLFNRTKLAEMGITDTKGFEDYYGDGVMTEPSNTIDGATKIFDGLSKDRKEDELLSDAYALKQDMRKKGFYDYTKGEKLTPEIWNKYKKEYPDNFIINRFIPVFEEQGQNNIEKLYNTHFPPLILNDSYNFIDPITDPFSPHLKNTKETPTFKTSDERIIHLLNEIVKNKDQNLNIAKYGGWLDQFQTGGWAGWTPNVGKPYMRTSPAGNAGYSDNTRVVTPFTGMDDATRARLDAQKAEEARRKRSGVISQGTPETSYQKAKRKSSFVEQEKERTGSAGPMSYVLDAVNPATYAFAATDLVGNTRSAVQNVAQGNLQEAGSDLLGAGINALTLLPVVAGAKGVVKPLSKFVGATPAQYKVAQQFANNPERAISQAVSYASKLAQSQINKNPRLALSLQRGRPISLDNVNTISGIQYGDVSSVGNFNKIKPNTISEGAFFKQLEKGAGSLDNSLQKRVADLESEEGFRRLVDQEKDYLFYNSDLEEDALERVAKINARARIDELKNTTNLNKEAAEFASTNFLNAGIPNRFVETSQLYDNAFRGAGYDDILSNMLSKRQGINLVKATPNYSKSVPGEIGIGYNYVGNKPIEMHEIAHSLQRGRRLNVDDQLRNIVPKKELTRDQKHAYEYFRKGSHRQEPSAFANELRESMLQSGIIPDYYSPISQQQIQDAYKYFKTKPMGTYNKNTGNFLSSTRILDFMAPNQSNSKLLSDILNKLPAVAPLAVGAAAASQLPEQKNGGWLNNYQDGGENLPELNSKIDIANFYKNPLSEKYGIYQDPTDKGYKYYLKSAEETNIPSKTFDFSGLNNIAKKINKKEIVSPEVIKYNPRIKDYTSDQDYLMESATKEFPIIPPSYEDVLSSIPKSETLNTIPKPKTLPNKQPVVNNTSVQNNFTFDSNYWSSPDIQAEIFNRQLKDNKWYGDFDKRGDNVLNRTDVKRNYDSEIFLQNLATPNSVVIDIGSALGNNNAQLAGVSVYELASNPKIKNKNIKVIATDIPSEVKGFEELKRRGNKVYPIDYAQVPETFNTPVRDILKSKNLENVKDVYLRAANSIDLLMNVQETSEHFKHISSSLKDKNVTYLYNNVILYKPAGSTKFKKLGNLNNSAFDHRAPTWKNNPNRNHYTLLPTNATGGQTGWLNKYK